MKSGVRTAKRAVDVAEAAAVKKKATYTELVLCCDIKKRKGGKTYTCNQASHTATPATADSKDANQKLDNGGDKSDDVGDEHPLGHRLVGAQSLLHTLRNRVLNTGVLQSPDIEGVEIERGLGLGAEAGLVVVAGDISRAVTPDTNRVEILEVQLRRGLVHDGIHVLIREVDAGFTGDGGCFGFDI